MSDLLPATLCGSDTHSDLAGKTFSVFTYGCQMNKHDSERIVGMLESLGAQRVEDTELASQIEASDIVVFMTCCVRQGAETRLKGIVSSLKNIPLRNNSPLSKRIVAVGGCIGQKDGKTLRAQLPHVDVVFGTFNLASVPRLLEETLITGDPAIEVLDSADSFPTSLPSTREHSWSAWLPISIGCNNFCTYCIVPHVRGREKSRPLEEIATDARDLVADGVKEITLLGQNVNSYGRDLYGAPQFAEVLKRVADSGVERIRFATSHPKDLSDDVIACFRDVPAVMPALHLPVQSGSNAILKAMNRRYTREHYLERVAALRDACPDIALATDIIVGFPGETDHDFEDTLKLVREVGYNQVFTFIFSPREGTPAAAMKNTGDPARIQQHFQMLVDEVQNQAFVLNQKERNTIVPVLIEGVSKKDPSLLTGRSPKNQTVHAELPLGVSLESVIGTTLPVHIDECKTWYLRGTVIQ